MFGLDPHYLVKYAITPSFAKFAVKSCLKRELLSSLGLGRQLFNLILEQLLNRRVVENV